MIVVDFLLKKLGDFSLNREILISKKIGPQAISLLFESWSSSIEVILGTSDSFDA